MDKNIEVESWAGWRIVWANKDNLPFLQEMLTAGVVDGVGISPYKGYEGDDLGFLALLSGVRGVVVPFAESFELDALKDCHGLEFISIGERCKRIDFSQFTGLTDLRIKFVSGDCLPDASAGLKSLSISGFKGKSKSLADLPPFMRLEELEIVSSNLMTLGGVERFEKLNNLSVCFCKNLADVSALVGLGLRLVNFESCKKVSNFEVLAGMGELKVLRLEDCGALESLRFLREFNSLEEFRFVNTKILDGDMSNLFGLLRVGFVSKREYSHTIEQVRAVIASNADRTI